jgi:hypothetical protein
VRRVQGLHGALQGTMRAGRGTFRPGRQAAALTGSKFEQSY